MNEGRDYYYINWTAFDEDGGKKEVPLSVSGDDGERVVLVFDSFDRAKRYMHTFLAKNGLVKRGELVPRIAVITIMGPALGSSDPGHSFKVEGGVSADVLARASRKSSVKYALLNPGSLTPALLKRSRVPLAEL